MFPFAVATFLGAFLLFLVQPLMGRYVLPWFGGSPNVWTTCLLFFQTALLAGYAYAHLLTQRCSPRRQASIHVGLLLGALLWLPPLPANSWKPLPGDDPTWRLLGLLTVSIGPLFVLLAATGPLVQRWFATCWPDRPPYRLYALSNAGSLLALLAYPVVIEPRWARVDQATGWSLGFGLFVIVAAATAWRSQRDGTALIAPVPAAANPPSLGQRIGWIGWPALASVLLLATTNALTLDVAAVPFLWIAPLAVYLLTFIIAFEYPRAYRAPLGAAGLVVAAALLVDLRQAGSALTFNALITTYLGALFVVALVCHGEVYRLRPAPARLTAFYLHVAAGGALGSFAVAVLAPRVFNAQYELSIGWSATLLLVVGQMVHRRDLRLARGLALGAVGALVAVPAFRTLDTWFTVDGLVDLAASFREFWASQSILFPAALLGLGLAFLTRGGAWLRQWRWRAGCAAAGLPLLLLALFWQRQDKPNATLIAQARSFYGVHTVMDYTPPHDARAASRFLSHGTTTHGIQLRDPAYNQWPTSYYAPESGIGLAFFRSGQHARRHVGVLGLGVGTLACYGAPGDHFTFYEIDPVVAHLAQTDFSFLQDSAATVDIRLGDGRLTLEREQNDGAAAPFDLLVLDAFASDAVPLHLLTREAFDLYLHRLAPGGVLAVNISNRFVNLAPVILSQAHAADLYAARVYHHPADDAWYNFPSEWILLARERATLDQPAITAVCSVTIPPAGDAVARWTDEHSSLWPFLR